MASFCTILVIPEETPPSLLIVCLFEDREYLPPLHCPPPLRALYRPCCVSYSHAIDHVSQIAEMPFRCRFLSPLPLVISSWSAVCGSTLVHPLHSLPRFISFAAENISSFLDDITVQRSYNGILNGERARLSEAITLVESTNTYKQRKAEQLLTLLLHEQKRKLVEVGKDAYSLRIGIG